MSATLPIVRLPADCACYFTYNLAKQQHVFASDQKQATLNVGVKVVHEQALHCVLQH